MHCFHAWLNLECYLLQLYTDSENLEYSSILGHVSNMHSAHRTHAATTYAQDLTKVSNLLYSKYVCTCARSIYRVCLCLTHTGDGNKNSEKTCRILSNKSPIAILGQKKPTAIDSKPGNKVWMASFHLVSIFFGRNVYVYTIHNPRKKTRQWQQHKNEDVSLKKGICMSQKRCRSWALQVTRSDETETGREKNMAMGNQHVKTHMCIYI